MIIRGNRIVNSRRSVILVTKYLQRICINYEKVIGTEN